MFKTKIIWSGNVSQTPRLSNSNRHLFYRNAHFLAEPVVVFQELSHFLVAPARASIFCSRRSKRARSTNTCSRSSCSFSAATSTVMNMFNRPELAITIKASNSSNDHGISLNTVSASQIGPEASHYRVESGRTAERTRPGPGSILSYRKYTSHWRAQPGSMEWCYTR